MQRDALNAAAAALADVSPTARLDAELLMAHALGQTREAMLLSGLQGDVPADFDALVTRRLAHEPMAYITGTREFWSLPIAVAPGVLIPRPDSETLIEAARAHFADQEPSFLLDLGTGSGALLFAALSEWPEAHGLGIDSSPAALSIAQANAAQLGFASRCFLLEGNWAHGVEGQFGLILCNPPYVETGADLPREVADHEPASALFAGPDGLDDYRIIAPQIGPLLAPGGCACIEIGKDQAEAVSALFDAEGLAVSVRKDLAGHDRCLVVTQK